MRFRNGNRVQFMVLICVGGTTRVVIAGLIRSVELFWRKDLCVMVSVRLLCVTGFRANSDKTRHWIWHFFGTF